MEMIELRNILSQKPVISYFDVRKPTEVFVDASPVGLGGMLVQYGNDNTPKVGR